MPTKKTVKKSAAKKPAPAKKAAAPKLKKGNIKPLFPTS